MAKQPFARFFAHASGPQTAADGVLEVVQAHVRNPTLSADVAMTEAFFDVGVLVACSASTIGWRRERSRPIIWILRARQNS